MHRAGQTFLTWQEVEPARLGLVTLENVRVSKARHRIQIGER